MDSLPPYIQKAIDLGLLNYDNKSLQIVNNNVIDKIEGVARIVDKLQPTTMAKQDDTISQEAIVLGLVLSSPSGKAREMWSELRTGFGIGHGQLIPQTLWSDDTFRAIAKEIDLIFIGDKTSKLITKESLITGYANLDSGYKSISIQQFSKTINELSDTSTVELYGESKTEWITALDILKQVRVRSLYLETLHIAKQNIKADTKLEEALEFLQKRAMEGVGMLRGSIGNMGQAITLTEAIIGNAGSGRENWIDRLSSATTRPKPASTGVHAFDIDIEGGVEYPDSNMAHEARLMTIAARTGAGKTALGCQVAANLAAQGITVGFLSAELAATPIESRIISSLSRKLLKNGAYHWLATEERVGHITVGELLSPQQNHNKDIVNILAQIAYEMQNIGSKFLVEAPWGACVDAAINSMRAMKAKNPDLRAVVLDHFHALARHKNAPSKTTDMLEERAYKLMSAAKELSIDLFVLAQMNQVGIKVAQNEFLKKQSSPPELDQIRGTDALSHVSHAVWLVRKHVQEDGEPSDRKLEIWHSKVRGRQAFWEGAPPNEEITSVKGFVPMSLVQLDYSTSSLKSDDTMQHKDIIYSRRIKR